MSHAESALHDSSSGSEKSNGSVMTIQSLLSRASRRSGKSESSMRSGTSIQREKNKLRKEILDMTSINNQEGGKKKNESLSPEETAKRKALLESKQKQFLENAKEWVKMKKEIVELNAEIASINAKKKIIETRVRQMDPVMNEYLNLKEKDRYDVKDGTCLFIDKKIKITEPYNPRNVGKYSADAMKAIGEQDYDFVAEKLMVLRDDKSAAHINWAEIPFNSPKAFCEVVENDYKLLAEIVAMYAHVAREKEIISELKLINQSEYEKCVIKRDKKIND